MRTLYHPLIINKQNIFIIKDDVFHTNNENCLGIKKWLEKSNTCPMCRTEFPCVEAPRLEINVEEIDQRLETVLNGILQRHAVPIPRHIHIFNPARLNPARLIQREEERQLQAAIQASLQNQ